MYVFGIATSTRNSEVYTLSLFHVTPPLDSNVSDTVNVIVHMSFKKLRIP